MTQTISSRELSYQRDKPPDVVSIGVQSDEFNQTVEQKEAQAVQEAFGSGLQVVHVAAERIRIRASSDSSKELLDAVIDRLRQQEGIKQVTWNEETHSLVIAFDKEVLSQSQLLAVLNEYGIRSSSEPNKKNQVDPFAAWKSVEFWKEQGIDLIPLLTGLAITSRLGISGLASIPIYMLTSDVTRRTISSFREALKAETKESKGESKSTNRISQPLVSKVEKTSTIERESLSNVVLPQTSEVNLEVAKIDYTIVHSIPGRIRFNVPRIGKDQAYARRLEELLKSESYATNVRLKSDAASIAISYQPASLDVSYWVDLIQLADEEVSNGVKNVKSVNQPNVKLADKLVEHEVESELEKKFQNKVENKVENRDIVQPQAQPVKAELVVERINELNRPISQATAPEATLNSMIADLKPPFMNVLIDVVAHFPLN